MKKVLFLSAIAAMAMASCSNDQEIEQPKKNEQFIDFSVLKTRSLPIATNSELQGTTFKVWGFTPAGVAYLGGENGVDVSYSTGSWTYSPKKSWPSEALNFVALNPATHTNLTELSMTGSSQTVKYEVATDVTQQVDVMYAVKQNQTKSSTPVNLVFKHALAQVAFKATTTDAKYTAEIGGIEVHNLKNKGTFTFPTSDTQAGFGNGAGSWNLESTYANYSIGIANTPAVSVTSTGVDVTANDGVLMSLPQEFTAWKTTKSSAVTIAQADENKHGYLKIQLKLKENNTYLVGSADAFATVYMPFGYTWDMGKKYIYNLKFGNGAGYDENGNPILQFIEFNPSVDTWIDVEVVDIEM